VALLGVGVAATGLFPSFAGLMFTITMMSVGFHYFETLNQSLTLQYFDRSTSPVVFGRLKGVASAANLAVGVAIFFAAPLLSYTAMYLCLGALVGAIGLGCLVMHPQRKDLAPQRKKMVVKRKYWLFYALTFMAGSRRQIFGAFAVYLLVKEFGYSVQAVTGLFVLNNVINSFWSPLIGRAINRFGERKVLTVEYAGLFFVFVGYALTRSPAFAAVLYVADHLFFNFAIAIRTYFQKIAEPEDIAPSSAVGFTINHIAAVVVPALGGALWLVDYRIVFISAACMSLGSLALAQFVRVPAPAEAGPSEAAPAGAADRPK
jgi:predicted MFS family arabinose efflux permease